MKTVKRVICILLILIGVGIILYPSISQYLYQKNSSKAIASYDDSVRKMKEEKQLLMIEEARRYNEELYSTGKMPEEYWGVLNVNGTGMMGYIMIPKLDKTIPVYHGTAEYTLQSGIGHLEDSSLPVGGENTHAVLTGHTGLSKADLFSDIEKLENDDIFLIKILDNTYAYKVNQILTVLPEQVNEIKIVEGKDYVTLITCTPYGINSHRLLIRGERIPYTEEIAKEAEEQELSFWNRLPIQYRHLIVCAFVLFDVIMVMEIIKEKRRKGKR